MSRHRQPLGVTRQVVGRKLRMERPADAGASPAPTLLWGANFSIPRPVATARRWSSVARSFSSSLTGQRSGGRPSRHERFRQGPGLVPRHRPEVLVRKTATIPKFGLLSPGAFRICESFRPTVVTADPDMKDLGEISVGIRLWSSNYYRHFEGTFWHSQETLHELFDSSRSEPAAGCGRPPHASSASRPSTAVKLIQPRHPPANGGTAWGPSGRVGTAPVSRRS